MNVTGARAADAVEPGGDQIGEPERRECGGAAPSSKPRQVEPLPGQHGHSTVMPRRIDQVGRAQRRPPRLGAALAGHRRTETATR